MPSRVANRLSCGDRSTHLRLNIAASAGAADFCSFSLRPAAGVSATKVRRRPDSEEKRQGDRSVERDDEATALCHCSGVYSAVALPGRVSGERDGLCAATVEPGRPLLVLWLRPPRHAGAVSGVRYNGTGPTRLMTHRLLNLLTVLSLVLLAAVLAAWATGRFVRLALTVGWDCREYVVAVERHVLFVGSEVAENEDLERPLLAVWLTRSLDHPYGFFGEGFGHLGVKNYGGLGVSGGRSCVERY